jgi:hypothetical protein
MQHRERQSWINGPPDFDERDDLQTNDAYLVSEQTHLEKVQTNM